MTEEENRDAALADVLPVSASVLSRQERRRRDALRERGLCGIGCGEVDGYVLVGGLERGSVVGISSEEEDFGVQMALQIIARTVWRGMKKGKAEKALVVSTQSTGTVARMLRDAVVAEIHAEEGEGEEQAADIKERVGMVLGMVSIVRVFDVKGVWEVLDDLDLDVEENAASAAPSTTTVPVSPVGRSSAPETEPKAPRDEIPDSDEEASLSPSPPPLAAMAPTPEPTQKEENPGLRKPDIILITHFSTLLTTLFTHTERTAAHTSLQLLSSRLRHFARVMSSSPLILITNSITTTTKHLETTATTSGPGGPPRRPTRRVDPTLRSIFDTPGIYSYGAGRSSGKPSFGLVFMQFLDLHLLCTRVPRTREDAEGMAMRRGGELVWVVEVLLDELGVWDGDGKGRKARERRWGFVDWVGGRIVDAFDGMATK